MYYLPIENEAADNSQGIEIYESLNILKALGFATNVCVSIIIEG